jgi:protein-S-isoprenylcysteine O-methyltransferase Ste14
MGTRIVVNIVVIVIILSSLNDSTGQLSNWTPPPWWEQVAIIVVPLAILNFIFRPRLPQSRWHEETLPNGQKVYVRDPEPQIGFFFWW